LNVADSIANHALLEWAVFAFAPILRLTLRPTLRRAS
jgi:hypothetical protein